jgi:hypothetical protein
VVLVSRFTEALQKLNRDIKSEAVKNTLEVITTDRSAGRIACWQTARHRCGASKQG